jgi:protein-S-isoprenylcysteine O-methyltransferase Ste14
MQAMELRVPPVAVLLVAAAAMWIVARLTPVFALPLALRAALALALAAAGIAIALAGILAFRRASTTVHPMRPGETTAIVASGVYAHSRNPMYLGMLAGLAGWAAWLASPAAALLLPAFVLYLNRWQIVPEERALTARFGAQYTSYARRVRRWI